MVIIEILSLIFILLFSLFALSLSLSFIIGPPYLPTPKNAIKEMLDITKVGKKDLIIDLGSGDGVVLIEAAMRGANSRGYEINPFLVLLTKTRARLKNLHNKISVHTKSYQKANFNGATVVFLYCMPKFMHVIENKLRDEAPDDIKIISYKFPLPNFKLIKRTPSGIYLYSLK